MFTKEDFEDSDNVEKLRLIIMQQLDLPLMTNFHTLDKSLQERFNNNLNNMYINALPDDWRDTVDADFGTICKTKLFNEKFRLQDYVPQKTFNTMETAEVLPSVTTSIFSVNVMGLSSLPKRLQNLDNLMFHHIFTCYSTITSMIRYCFFQYR